MDIVCFYCLFNCKEIKRFGRWLNVIVLLFSYFLFIWKNDKFIFYIYLKCFFIKKIWFKSDKDVKNRDKIF